MSIIVLDSFSLAVMLVLSVMIVLVAVAYVIAKNSMRAVHETGVALLIGMAVSAVAATSLSAESMKTYLGFNTRFFFVFLLPPVIFNSGYAMQQRYFFANISAVGVYAFLGTIISFALTSIFMIGAGFMGIHTWSNLECFLFGAIITATDTVGVIAIVEKAPVSRDLFSIVMGESVFNDAVAIVLHETCMHFVHEEVTRQTLIAAVFFFLIVFLGSTLIGVVFGVCATLFFKNFDMRGHPHLEFGIMLMWAYSSYFVCMGLSMSGVCSILFCGVVMSHYTVPNLSEEARHVTQHSFHPISYVCETFVFLSLGLSFLAFHMEYKIVIVLAVCVVIVVSRSSQIFALGALLNRFRSPTHQLSWRDMAFLAYAAPRGGMAFALALTVHTDHAAQMLGTTFAICLITVLMLGATTYPLLIHLKLLKFSKSAQEIADELAAAQAAAASASAAAVAGAHGKDDEHGAGAHGGHGAGDGATVDELDLSRMESAFNRFDRVYIKPRLIREDRLAEFAFEAPVRLDLSVLQEDVDVSSIIAGSRTTSVALVETPSANRGPIASLDADSLMWD